MSNRLMSVNVDKMDAEEARLIADEVLKIIVDKKDFAHVKDLIGRELDLTDEILEKAVDILFTGQK